MSFIYSLFFAAGVSTFFYTKVGRRVGYSNTKNIMTLLTVVFILALLVFYSFFAFVIHVKK